MIVRSIALEGFRNYKRAAVKFSDGVNIIAGSNAQGKTNLIEAIFFLSAGRSFRTGGDKDFIFFGADSAYIKADIFTAEREQTLEAKLSHGKRREFFSNGVKLSKAAELSGRLRVVLFSPDDLGMIKDGAAVRRKLLDSCLSQLRPRYLSALSEFNRLYERKTRILRNWREKPSLLDLLDDFDLRLAQHSALLIYYRSAFSSFLAQKAAAIHNEFSGGREKLVIKYKSAVAADNRKPEELLPDLLEHQKKHRQPELASGLCLSGAHKDDLDISINGVPARKFASQGQARTAAVSIKLAERDIHFDDRGEFPVLLLDDVLSELDPQRQSFLISHIPRGQVFITCCDYSQISAAADGSVFNVENGSLFFP